MKSKLLLINSNLPYPSENEIGDIQIFRTTFEKLPTLHDYHILIIDTTDMTEKKFWTNVGWIEFQKIQARILEQIKSGGITFCFCGKSTKIPVDTRFVERIDKMGDVVQTSHSLWNYFFLPSDVEIIGDYGDTFYPNYNDLRYLKPLFTSKDIPLEDIEYGCYFSKFPKDTKILGHNRANYGVSIEIPIKSGKMIMLPMFKNKKLAFEIIVKEIIPQILKDEDINFLEPKWTNEFVLPFEDELKNKLNQIRSIKKILYTKNRALEQSVIVCLKLLGFEVKKLNKGSYADILISDNEIKALVEVKGHNNRQSKKVEISQLYLSFADRSDVDDKTKIIFIVNHEFEKNPNERKKVGFTQDAIVAGEKIDAALISTTDFFPIILKIIQNGIDENERENLRDKIMHTSGIVNFS